MPHRRVGLTLGPLFYLWDDPRWRDFYFRIADEADLDIVVLGEVVCSKRDHFHTDTLDEVANRLTAAGKTVRLASLALVTLERELKAVRRLAAQDAFEVEVGELAAHGAMRGRPHAIGPLVNVYNAATAHVLAKGGATSIWLPPNCRRHRSAPSSPVRPGWISRSSPSAGCRLPSPPAAPTPASRA